MRKISDEPGWIRVVVCSVVLLLHHGLRDALITALPTLAASDPPTKTTLSPSGESAATAIYSSQTHVKAVSTNGTTTLASTVTYPSANILRSKLNDLLNDAASTERGSDGASVAVGHLASDALGLKARNTWQRNGLTETISQTRTENIPVDISLLKVKSERGSIQSGSVENVLSRFPLVAFRGMRDINSPLGNVKDKELIFREGRGREVYIHESNKIVSEGKSVNHKHEYNIPEDVKLREGRVTSRAPSSDWQWQNSWGKVDIVKQEKKYQQKGPLLKDEWTVVIEGAVLSSVFWGWFLSGLIADLLMDRAGVVAVLGVSLGLTGVLGLLTHAASLGGPWVLLALRGVQGLVQGVAYPAVVRVLEGLPPAIRTYAALIVFSGSAVGSGVGAGLGSVQQWYAATYSVGGVAVVLTPLCLMLPLPSEDAPHKEMPWKSVLSSRGVWVCVAVHVANTWMLHTLLVGLPLYLTYSLLLQPLSAMSWVVAAVAMTVCAVVQFLLFVASKLSGKRSLTVLNRRRIPVVVGTVLVTTAAIVMATAGLDSVKVLVGVGVGLGGVGVGVARVGYRLNVDDMAPQEAWRVTKVLDAAAVLTAAMSPLVVSALAQVGDKAWAGVWLMPLAAFLPAAAIHLFLLTSNSQLWDETDKSNVVAENGAVGGDATKNGSAPTPSVGRESMKSARSALTFKTARSRSRSRTMTFRTTDDDLECDMYSIANTITDCRSLPDELDRECVSVASSSTFKSDGADMHSVVEEGEGGKPAHQFVSMLVNGGTADRTSAWLSSHHHINAEAGGDKASSTRADTHATNAIYGLLW